jgi:hypothetical protein
LTETTAGQALSSLLRVLDQAPHAVLIDLALPTSLNQPGAGAITVAARCSPDTPIILIDPRGRDRALARRHRATHRVRPGMVQVTDATRTPVVGSGRSA